MNSMYNAAVLAEVLNNPSFALTGSQYLNGKGNDFDFMVIGMSVKLQWLHDRGFKLVREGSYRDLVYRLEGSPQIDIQLLSKSVFDAKLLIQQAMRDEGFMGEVLKNKVFARHIWHLCEMIVCRVLTSSK